MFLRVGLQLRAVSLFIYVFTTFRRRPIATDSLREMYVVLKSEYGCSTFEVTYCRFSSLTDPSF